MRSLAKKGHENSAPEVHKAKKKNPLGELVQRQVNPLWHRMATQATQDPVAGSSRFKAGNAIQAKVAVSHTTERLQRLCTECDEEMSELQPNPIQPKLAIGAADDTYEREADAVADTVMRTPVSAVHSTPARAIASNDTPDTWLQRQCAACESADMSSDIEPVQRTSDIATHSHRANGHLQAFMRSPGAGATLANAVRHRVEPVLGADLSGVRVHADQRAQDAARTIQAKAFTNRNNIYLGAGQSSDDVRLMAHESTHTVQQGAADQLVQRDATNQTITPAYASQLSSDELLREITAVNDLLSSTTATSLFEDTSRRNLEILWQEYFKRGTPEPRTPEQFQAGAPCYDRKTQPWTMVVDAHVHYEPFGGPSVPTPNLYDFFRRANVLFTSAYGIGQVLPASSGCTYYLDCPWVPVRPSMKNDFINAMNLRNFDTKGVHTIISRTFPDPAKPEEVLWRTALLDMHFPDTFKGMGEINVVKLALRENWHSPTPVSKIAEWAPFMKFLELRDMPIALHSDLGSDPLPLVDVGPKPQSPWPSGPRIDECKGHACHQDYGPRSQSPWTQVAPGLYDSLLRQIVVQAKQTEYLYLMEEVLRRYPQNKVVWMHMGLSKELVTIDPDFHIGILSRLLDKYPKLMLDISWKVLYENYFDPVKHPEKRKKYVEFFNAYPNRIITGTDFIADKKKKFEDYEKVVELNSDILKDLDNNAFRQIALGENYFRLYSLPYTAPDICADPMERDDVLKWTDKAVTGVSKK